MIFCKPAIQCPIANKIMNSMIAAACPAVAPNELALVIE